MTEDIARRSIDWLYDRGCRVLGLMGGEPLLRPQFVHKVVYYAAKRGFWIYIGTNGRLLRPEIADRSEMRVLPCTTLPWMRGTKSLACPKRWFRSRTTLST
jgi:MoaA/NifB/PqqE/SkfB family radical SAM enzyme